MKKALKIVGLVATYTLYTTAIAIVLYVLVAYVGRIFVADTFRVPTYSMSPTLIAGDKIIVNKLLFGARIYTDLDSAVVSRNPDMIKTWGLRKIRRNDVLVFNMPVPYTWSEIEFNIQLAFCKRCIGLPGDTVSIVNGTYHVNNHPDTVGFIPEQIRLSQLDTADIVDGVLRTLPYDEKVGWTVKDFGPLYTPKSGEKIAIDTINIKLYSNVIRFETGFIPQYDNGVVTLNDVPLTSYCFKDNYYFMGGDNVLDSQDSRYWGFLPEKHIIGIDTHILYSRHPDTNKLRWDRVLKRIE